MVTFGFLLAWAISCVLLRGALMIAVDDTKPTEERLMNLFLWLISPVTLLIGILFLILTPNIDPEE